MIPYPASSPMAKSALKTILMALFYFAAGAISLAVASENNIVTIVIFAAEGFSLAGVLLFGRSVIPGIFLGQLSLALYQSVPLPAAVGITIGNTLEAYLAWKIVTEYLPIDRSLSTFKDLFRLFFLSLFILQPFSALFGTFSLFLAGELPPESYLTTLLSWWFGNTLGQMLWTPMLLLLYTRSTARSWTPLLLYVLGFGILDYMLFFELDDTNLPLLITITMPAILYVTIKRGTLYGAVLTVVLSLVTLYATYNHTGFFASRSTLENVLNLNFYILSHILVILGTGVLHDELSATRRALARLNHSLEDKVRKQIEKLNHQNTLLARQAKLASMGEMLGMISHQWRQPLNRINSNIAVIDKLTQDHCSENAMLHEKIENVKKQTLFMSQTIDEFSSFFRPDKERHLFLPAEEVHKAIALMETEMMHVITDFSIESETPVSGYRNEFHQVVLTILHNALENFQARGIDTPPRLHFSLCEGEDGVQLQIDDNGGGIEQTRIEAIFDPYFTTNQSGRNSGLGLYMAKLLIEESMYGRLTAENTPEGARFTITLPKGEDDAK